MTHRLRHRARYPPEALASSLSLRRARTHAPAEWRWAWPLTPSPSPDAVFPTTIPAAASAARAAAVADDASCLAILSQHGLAALCISPSPTPVDLLPTLEPACLPPPSSLCDTATSIALFPHSSPPSGPRTLAAVGYASGAIALFDAKTRTPLFVTRVTPDHPIRRLRLHAPHPPRPPALFAVLGWSGHLALLETRDLPPLIPAIPTPEDPHGAGWHIWATTSQDALLDATPVGPAPLSVLEPDAPPATAALRLLTGGMNPPLSAHAATTAPAFSARAAAARAAATVLTAARGFLLSRMGATEPVTPAEPRGAITGISRHSASWADDTTSTSALPNLADVRSSARSSVAAALARARRAPLPSAAPALEHQRSQFGAPAAKTAARLPHNARIVELLAPAPPPCPLVATRDTLGRIFLQDPRDLCVLRVLKGYRDAQIAWLADGGPLLAVYAPRLHVLELHAPLEPRRLLAFRVPPGCMLVQSAAFRVFCVAGDGRLFELVRSRKGQDAGVGRVGAARKGALALRAAQMSDGDDGVEDDDVSDPDERRRTLLQTSSPDYELVGAFVDAVKAGRTSRAVECLQRVEKDSFKLAHLMATLLTCTSFIRTEVHVALASKAAQLATSARATDLVARFEAHGRLAEAFALLATDKAPVDILGQGAHVSPYGARLLEDDLGAGLVEFALAERRSAASPSFRTSGKRMRAATASGENELVNCERFILAHALEPMTDLSSEAEYELCPHPDLSEAEQIWLAKAYFSRLLETDSVELPTAGREHPISRDVFLALTDFVGLPDAELVHLFALFFLHTPLLPLLNTPVLLYASPLRCALSRLRATIPREVVDPILLETSENSPRVMNAVLLMRLCAVQEDRISNNESKVPFMEALDRLGEVMLFRKLIGGSDVRTETAEMFTAHHCSGASGDAERHAVSCLIEVGNYSQAASILSGLEASQKLKNLEWHESAAVSEAALHACRKQAAGFITEESGAVIVDSVLKWIRSADGSDTNGKPAERTGPAREICLRGIRAVLLSAHPYLPDSSVDAVRCLQLAEAMSAILELEKSSGESVPVVNLVSDESDMDIGEGRMDADASADRKVESDGEEYFDAPAENTFYSDTENEQGRSEPANMSDG